MSENLSFQVVAVSIKRAPISTGTTTGEQQTSMQLPSIQPTRSLITPTSTNTFLANEPNNNQSTSRYGEQNPNETLGDILRRLRQEHPNQRSAGGNSGAKPRPRSSTVVVNKPKNNQSGVRKGHAPRKGHALRKGHVQS
ncbi:uncharacterized protein M437DRAFT_70759 [Aureobasidium melanogenum CBS 110374]|uniref:Uncharacterized protein n=1 Tax=Aureobasidium melanogenum (strain CBS 110374) TaxID=1043003 RepID=A0A074VA29_AURM1|nr:uncharacterized protein M437DRAFT_70759 [Aureobasidium melanogenum CBS 110374]KEQ57490.1 hypothetical protein M437DRAFT_70759 [Aureobasidium melanogenum CBS 110374]